MPAGGVSLTAARLQATVATEEGVASFGGLKNTPNSLDAIDQNSENSSYQGRKTTMSAFSDSMQGKGLWDRYIKQAHFGGSETGTEDASIVTDCTEAVSKSFREIWRKSGIALRSPEIGLTGLVVLLMLLGATIAPLVAWADSSVKIRIAGAEDAALELATAVSNELDVALLPLFTIRTFVKQLPQFQEMHSLVSASPKNPGKTREVDGVAYITHRNLTGIFNESTVNTFNSIAKTMIETNGISDLIANVQLAPKAVVSVIYPLVETRNLSSGQILAQNNNGAIGHDLLNDPARVAIARATVPASGVVTAGPLNLVQGSFSMIARLAINFDEDDRYNITIPAYDSIPEKSYNCWGFAVVIINWDALIYQVGIHKRFEDQGLLFSLTREDKRIQPDGSVTSSKAVIAESKTITDGRNATTGISNVTIPQNVTKKLNTTNNEWEMQVGYPDGFAVSWLGWSIAVSVIGSVAFAILVMYALVNRKEHQLLLYKMMPKKAIAKLQRGQSVIEKYDQVTIFFSDIVGFTSMAGEMTPMQVMAMLNDLYTEFDALVDKHKVYKVETIGDAYMVLGGAPDVCPGSDAAEKVAMFALEALNVVRNFRKEDGTTVYIRCGLASGPVVAGVVGRAMPRYCLFGDTVNYASRMESTSSKMKIQVAELTYFLLMRARNQVFKMRPRMGADGKHGVSVKGKGRVMTYWVDGVEGNEILRATSVGDVPEEGGPSNGTPEKAEVAHKEEVVVVVESEQGPVGKGLERSYSSGAEGSLNPQIESKQWYDPVEAGTVVGAVEAPAALRLPVVTEFELVGDA